MLIQLREQLHEQPGGTGRLEMLAYRSWAWWLRSPLRYGLATWWATRTIGRWRRATPWLRRLPGQLHGWTVQRDFPAPASERFRDWWRREGVKENSVGT
jgi:L-lactate dehydrogenase complex protein LldF